MTLGASKWVEAVNAGRILWREHATLQMLRRQISRNEVIRVLLAADGIEHYPDDQPYPSVLLIGQPEGRLLHVVAAFDQVNERVCVITAYEPDLQHFDPGFRRRRTQ